MRTRILRQACSTKEVAAWRRSYASSRFPGAAASSVGGPDLPGGACRLRPVHSRRGADDERRDCRRRQRRAGRCAPRRHADASQCGNRADADRCDRSRRPVPRGRIASWSVRAASRASRVRAGRSDGHHPDGWQRGRPERHAAAAGRAGVGVGHRGSANHRDREGRSVGRDHTGADADAPAGHAAADGPGPADARHEPGRGAAAQGELQHRRRRVHQRLGAARGRRLEQGREYRRAAAGLPAGGYPRVQDSTSASRRRSTDGRRVAR